MIVSAIDREDMQLWEGENALTLAIGSLMPSLGQVPFSAPESIPVVTQSLAFALLLLGCHSKDGRSLKRVMIRLITSFYCLEKTMQGMEEMENEEGDSRKFSSCRYMNESRKRFWNQLFS
jgi:hypothetical protein